MSYQSKFNRMLDSLYKRRTSWLRSVVSRPRPGRPQSFSRKKREQKIRELQEITSEAQAKRLAKEEFKRFDAKKRPWRGKGRGLLAKKANFNHWVREKVHGKRGKVYVFWAGSRCLYVGRSRGKGSRPSDHFKRKWFRKATRVDVFLTRKRSAISLLECLAIHRFLPSENKVKAARKKWTPRCPLCRLHRDIRRELRQIFRFR